MNEENKIKLANRVYKTLCNAIEKRNWTFERDDTELLVHFGVSGDDIPMQFVLIVDAQRQLVRLASLLPFKMSEAKRVEGAVATCAATYSLNDGCFDYDINDGSIAFRMTASFVNSVINEELFQYMIACACVTVDEYNDRFLALDKGATTIAEFIENN